MGSAKLVEGAWRNQVFIDEVSERLVLGQLLVHPGRWGEVRVGVDHFTGPQHTVFQLLARQLSAGRLDLGALATETRRAGVYPLLLLDLIDEWLSNPAPLYWLQPELEARLVRRQINVRGEVLIEVARDPGMDIVTVRATAGRIARELGGLVRHELGQPETMVGI